MKTKHEIEATHTRACNSPRVGHELALRQLFRGLRDLAEAHERRYGGRIADDGVLGPAWLDMAKGLETHLNGELGRLDGGLLDRELRDLAYMAGFTRDLTERT